MRHRIQVTQQPKGQCRFCLEDDVVQNLISPCVCTGSAKYVHNTCLINWYNHQPTKGLNCSVCKIAFQRKFNQIVEQIPTYTMLEQIPLQHPFYTVIGNHLMFFGFLYGITPVLIPYRHILYTVYQLIFHMYYGFEFVGFISQLRTQKMYWSLWLQDYRYVLPLAHVCFVASMTQTFWVAGMSADICVMMYFFEHLEILSQLNQLATFEFTNHPVDSAALAQ
jgi:hypothetical protein